MTKISDSITCSLYLASRSPRRSRLMKEAGYVFQVLPASEEAEDGIAENELPVDYVKRLAFQKASNVAGKIESGLIIGCDTLVLAHGEILGKPKDIEDARRMHRLLRGERHYVLSGLCVLRKPGSYVKIDHAETVLEMHERTDEEIETYLQSGAWAGKAGAFGYQDGLDWVRLIEGSESNIVGLPMELLEIMLRKAKEPEA